MESLLILGGNSATAGLVTTARSMGVRTIVIDMNPRAYAKKFADVSYDIDGTDVAGIEKIARDEKVDGIMLGAVEELMDTYQKVCEGLGMRCYATKDLLDLFSDKNAFKEACKANGVPTTEGGLYGLSDIDSLKDEKFPLIVKPVDSSGSRGIRVCYSFDELRSAIESALSFSELDKVLVERYMTGQEVVVYYAFQDGNPVFLGICDRYTNHERASRAQLPTSYVFPSRYTKGYMESEDATVKEMFRKVGVRNGVMFLQGFADDDGTLRFYESGYRLNGAQEHHIFANLCGIDAKRMMVEFALRGRMADSDLSQKADPLLGGRYGCKLSVLMEPGTIADVVGLDEISRMDGVIFVNPSYEVGETVKDAGTLKQIVCRFFIVADTLSDLKKRIDDIYRAYDVLDDHGESLLMEQFNTGLLDKNYR